ncbi:ATP-binding protein [Butyrivibrio sp. AE2005]|uniref:ATP-binding protein n=1 Tax=Butyrivibrio sp. AE2005 TaxID=1496722 RepID=UPI000479B4C7|nr:ATP-binding protein [Butyrivibrio sp. AE2005]
MNDVAKINPTDIAETDISIENRLEIIEDGIRKKYLARLSDMFIASVDNLCSLEEDIIDNIRLYRVTEMVYQKGESAVDKFTTVFNTISTYNASVYIIIDSDGKKTDFYIGVRNNETDDLLKRSTVTLGDTLKNTLIGHFPGIKIQNEDRKKIEKLSNKIYSQHNVASVSVVGSNKLVNAQNNEQFVQGLEKLALAMYGRQYVGIIIAENQSPQMIQNLRKSYQNLYTKLSPLQKIQFSESESESSSRSKSFAEMDGKQKAAMIGGAVASIAGVVGGAFLGEAAKVGATGGAMFGGQVAGQLNGFINSLAPNEQLTKNTTTQTSTTTENKEVTDILQLIDESIKKTNEYDSYGMWNVAGYFASDDMSAAEIAASNYRSLMSGDTSGREVAAINSWRSNNPNLNGDFSDLTTYISRFVHPKFCYGNSEDYVVLTDASTAISGKELGLHLGFPRTTVPGLPVIEHAEFGKEVFSYRLFSKKTSLAPEDRMTLGRVFDLGQITNKVVELDNKSLNMHTFITGSTGSGKSNTVYQMLNELHQDKIPFLVVEPAKGEYKDVFGNYSDVNVFSTNPKIAELININPFMFPESIHVLEHVDGLVEIFSVCWPMYDAMPAFFKDAILKSYEIVGWDLGSSTFDGEEVEYPDFEILAEQLNELIEESDYASDIKSNYRGALITRVRSLTVGLNKYIFCSGQTPYKRIFDDNCVLDISRVKSGETKALIMGLIVYILNEYRVDRKVANNNGLKHVTVLEEAHNLLKNTSGGGDSELVGKSVEMLTQTIAEIRTYGEGFIIVDQSPSSVDISAIKNTNTKIVLRTPEANDREAVGRSMGLTEDQVNEIAKLPSGVAVVYQNDWVSPVLTMIDKAPVIDDVPYVNSNPVKIRPLKEARLELVSVLMSPWIKHERIRKKVLLQDLKAIDLSSNHRKIIMKYINDYVFFCGKLVWDVEEIPKLQKSLMAILGITESDYERIIDSEMPDMLREAVIKKTKGFGAQEVDEICHVLTKVVK